MQPEQTQPTLATAPQPQPSPAPLNPIAQFECWYLPEGSYTIFGYHKSLVVLYPGWMVVYRKADKSELARFPLGPDLKMKYLFGFVRFAQLNGKKYSAFKLSNIFMTTPMWAYGAFAVCLILNFMVSVNRIGNPRDPLMPLLSLVILLFALGFLVAGIPKAKALKDAAMRAAGVAS